MEYEYDILATRLRELAFLNQGIKITIEDKRVENKHNEYHYEGGIKSYVEHLNRTKEVIHEEPIYIEGERDGITVEVALQYNEGYTEISIPLPIIFIPMKAEHMNQVLRRFNESNK